MMAERGALRSRSEAAIRVGSRSFAAASLVFEPRTRESVHHLYAWCRYCDDCVDEQELGHHPRAGGDGAGARDSAAEAGPRGDRRARLERLREATRAAFRRARSDGPVDGSVGSSVGSSVGGSVDVPRSEREEAVFAALECVVRRHDLPERACMELLEGFAMDVEGRRYATIDDTLRYAYHVAGVVGVMMAHVVGVRDDATRDRAADLGIAMQLTNIARDVLDDAAVGRVYLPESWLREAGMPAAPAVRVLAASVAAEDGRAKVVRVVHRLLDVADRYYESGRLGIGALRWRHAWAVASAAHVYRDIGRIVRRRGRDAWKQRARTGAGRKATAFAIGAFAATRSRFGSGASSRSSREGLFERPRAGDANREREGKGEGEARGVTDTRDAGEVRAASSPTTDPPRQPA